ncbi:uncharacterized protein BP5553_01794 [Venustampulla echinocandica]|uniref:BZIP domain-containing protein n=1 Tax=Venustampulla echinocandica TaxID=2656787 RepID=A0A370U234_9HELO|nr:uncharacterized protein BP5553_01794 [Venustampulla echinocandica]RDL41815.1 hypothetical protein BP5553_01794 [Venustampulla echinocandica]
MDSPYNFAQDDYARAIMMPATAAATITTYKYDGTIPTSLGITGLPGPTRQISNHQLDPRNLNNPVGSTKAATPNMSEHYNPPFPASISMETVVFNHGHGGNQNHNNPFLDHGFRGIGAEISRNYANNLGVLNAETYNADGASEKGPRKRNKEVSAELNMVFGLRVDSEEPESKNGYEEPEGTRRKKKPRLESNSADDDEDARKKARGRPRVDTKDETAADRRRTQIRLAQRAYRHRKETTISSLEKQVQELRGTNEEMSSIFITLHDFAVAKGILQREPDFGQQLQSTTERFLALAKASSEYLSQDEGQPEEIEKQDRPSDERATTTKKKKGALKSPRIQPEVAPPMPPMSANPFPGRILNGESTNPVEEIQTDYHYPNYGDMTGQEEHQIITRPTVQNASFPFDFTDYQQYRVDAPSVEDFSQYFSPESQPSLPRSYSHGELSFARRLQRQALETAMKLVTSPNMPQDIYLRIFGFAALYESPEAIVQRLKNFIRTSTKDSLQNWRAPFVHLGGAGTFYPTHEGDVNEELMPKIRTGFSMGPFSPTVAQAQEVIQEDMRLNFPGFEGEFFDPNDVEGYLRGRGLNIPPSADAVTVQIDFSLLSESSSTNSSSAASVTTIVSPSTPKSSIQDLLVQPQGFEESYNFDPNQLNSGTYSFTSIQSKPYPTAKESGNIEPSLFTMADPNPATDTPNTFSGKRQLEKSTIVMNVETLLEELISRGVCLGRTPGFRPSDVNAAIVAAAKAGYSV